jgi:hypothetical protein
MGFDTRQKNVVPGMEFLRRRVEMIPSSQIRRLQLATALADAGYLGDALSEIRELLRRDPHNLGAAALRDTLYERLRSSNPRN